MKNKESQNQSEFQKELEETVLLKSIQKGKLLQAPAGYYRQLNEQILDRTGQSQDQVSDTRIFNMPAIARWAGIAAVIVLSFFIWIEFRNETRTETAFSQNPSSVETVPEMDSSLLEISELQSIDEHLLADELITKPVQQPADSIILNQELTEYLLLHADHDLLLESL